ncbi:sulfatase [Candidatus Hydrogenedentota bacterium]
MNVIVIMSDSYRWDHLGHNGNTNIKTPCLDAFAEKSAIFDNYYVDNLPTLPMRASAFMGRLTFPFRGWEDMLPGDDRLAMMLFHRGINTSIVFDSFPFFHMGHGYIEGFQTVDMMRQGRAVYMKDDYPPDLYPDEWFFQEGRGVNEAVLPKGFLKFRRSWTTEEQFGSARTVNHAKRWLDNYQEDYSRKEPFMLWVDIFDPHEPWLAPDEYWRPDMPENFEGVLPICPNPRHEDFYLTEMEQQACHALYGGCCKFTDKWIGKLLNHVEKLGLMDDTMIIFTSDHGLPIGDGKWGHGLYCKWRPWPYDEIAHAPFVVYHPEMKNAGKRFDTFAQPCDMTATILDFFNTNMTERMHGRSLLPVMTGEKEKIRDFAFACHAERGGSRSIRTKEWTYIYWPGQTMSHGSIVETRDPELYRRDADLTELNNVIDEYPEVAKDMEIQMRRFEEKLLDEENPEPLWDNRPL